MATKRKYPKSFYDDGLGDILDWIDDEVLANSEAKELRRSKSRSKQGTSTELDVKEIRKSKKKTKLYGENEIVDGELKVASELKVKFLDEDDEKVDKKLNDRTRGLINRLASQNISYISDEFEKLYSTNARVLVNQALFCNIETSVISKEAIAKRKLIAEQMLLIAYLDFKISHDIGSTMIHRLVCKFEKLYTDITDEGDKRLDNVLLCLLNLYIIGLISFKVIFELTKRICERDFGAKSVELMLLVVKSVGFQLRKDDPASTRELIITAQNRCKQLQDEAQVCSRVEFMIETLNAIKNNNMSKIVNYGCDVDRDTIESVLKGLIKRTKLPDCLSDSTYQEILNSPNWYLLEARCDEAPTRAKQASESMVSLSGKKEMKICKALGLNKPSERTIFSALSRASDYIEASNVIIGYGLNHCSDAMLVCIHVAIHEKKYNPFHFNLINSLCKFNRKYKMAAKFSIQDKIRTLGQLESKRVDIFKVLSLELIKSDAIPITILKAIEWANLGGGTKEYLIYLLEGISDLPEEERAKVMSKVDKKSSFAGAMRTFINCFLKGCKLF